MTGVWTLSMSRSYFQTHDSNDYDTRLCHRLLHLSRTEYEEGLFVVLRICRMFVIYISARFTVVTRAVRARWFSTFFFVVSAVAARTLYGTFVATRKFSAFSHTRLAVCEFSSSSLDLE